MVINYYTAAAAESKHPECEQWQNDSPDWRCQRCCQREYITLLNSAAHHHRF